MPNAGGVRVVVDTNVLVSGLFWHGTPHRLIEHIQAGTLTLIISPALLSELGDVLRRPKFKDALLRSRTDVEQTLSELQAMAEIADPPLLSEPVSRDPDDDVVLALAAAANADMIVSGDADLLELGSYADIPIVDAAEAIRRI